MCPNCFGGLSADTCARCSGRPQIDCNGYPLPVTRNCLNALITLRQCEILGPIWIDAICINQLDIQERSAQVARIGDVFRGAEEVVVCLCEEQLGLTAPAAPLPALKFSTEQAQYLTEVDRRDFGDSSHVFSDPSTVLLAPELFYRSPWFTRTWIVQEVMLARRLVVVPEFGGQPISWRHVNHAYSIWSKKSFSWDVPDVVRLKQAGNDFCVVSDSALKPFNIGAGMDYGQLFEMLETTRHFRCKEPADKLFAILPLFAQPTPAILSADYSKSVADVFKDLTWFLLLSNQPEILSLASLYDQGTDKPSWVVNWSDRTPQASRLELHHRPSRWSAGCWPNFRHMHLARKSDNVLVVRGLILDHIDVTACGTHLRTRQYPARANDKVCVFLGFRTLFLLRHYGSGFQLVDECAVDGFMHGEAIAHIDPSRAYDLEPPSGLVDFEIH